MKVEATRLGYYDGSRRKEGAVFMLEDAKAFSKVWMKKLEAASEEPQEKKKPAKDDGKHAPSTGDKKVI